MKVYFIKDSEPHGKKGDVKIVSDGFARNYLLKKGIAVEFSQSIMKHIQEINRQKEQKEKRILAQAEKESKKVDGKTIEFRLAVKDDKKLYGSVRETDIEERIKNKFNVKMPFEVKLEEPIKEVGKFEVEIVFGGRVKAKINVIVSGN